MKHFTMIENEYDHLSYINYTVTAARDNKDPDCTVNMPE